MMRYKSLLIVNIILVLISANKSSAQILGEPSDKFTPFTNLDSALMHTENVSELRILNNNKYNTFPKTIFNLNNLIILSFSGSWCDIDSCVNINVIPEGIAELHKLRELYLVSNNLKKLPDEINNLKNLTILDLSENPEIDITNLENKNLQALYLNGCSLRKIPGNIFELDLKVLGLGNNYFDSESINELKKMMPNTTIYH